MKRIKNVGIVLATGLALGLGACKDSFLDLKPNNSITDQSFYQTEADAIQATNAVYSPAQGLFNGAGWQILDIMTDDSDKGGGGANDGVEVYELDNFTLTSFNPMVLNYYTQCYLGVQRANLVIDKVPGIVNMSETTRKRCLGEAYFLRGFYYYMLVRLYGDVPLYTKPITLEESYQIKRSPKAQVYDTLLADFQRAAELLPLERMTGENAGRVSSGAATGMMASAYLTLGNKAKAAEKALEVINSGIYSLTTNYAANFSVYSENGPESLYQVQYRNAGQTWNFWGQGSVMNCFMAPRAQNIVQSSGYGFNVPTADFVSEYEKNSAGTIIDRRRITSIWMPGDRFDTYTQPAALEGSPLGYNCKKYFVPISDGNADSGGWSCAGNVNVLRYAEILLIAAEALGPGAGETYINQVRTRAGLPNLQTGLSEADYLEAVYKERRLELSFEMHRWFDLIRHPEPNYMITRMQAVGKNPQPKHYLMPIPQQERDKNPNLTQNPGY